jgi:hypothetical protein
MTNYGRQLKFYGKTSAQISTVVSSLKLPSVQFEICKANDWSEKWLYQLNPTEDLLCLAVYLLKWTKKEQVRFDQSKNGSKVLTVKYNLDGTLYVGIFDNSRHGTQGINKVMDASATFHIRALVLSQLAELYGCSVSDVLNLIKLDLTVLSESI